MRRFIYENVYRWEAVDYIAVEEGVELDVKEKFFLHDLLCLQYNIDLFLRGIRLLELVLVGGDSVVGDFWKLSVCTIFAK